MPPDLSAATAPPPPSSLGALPDEATEPGARDPGATLPDLATGSGGQEGVSGAEGRPHVAVDEVPVVPCVRPLWVSYGHTGRIWDVTFGSGCIVSASEDCSCKCGFLISLFLPADVFHYTPL